MEITQVKKSFQNQSLGYLESFNEEAQGISGQTSNGLFRVTVYSEGIFRIRICKEEFDVDASYAVIKEAEGGFTFTDKGDYLLIETQKAKLKVMKAPVRFSLLNLNDEIINEDDPAFGTSWMGDQVSTYKKLVKDEKFVGLGEKTGPLNRRGKGYVNWNTDSFAYGSEDDPLYSSIPFYIGIHSGLQYGVFFDNPHKSHFNFGASNDRFSSFSADLGEMDYYYIAGDTVADILNEYTSLTGRSHLPPLWSLGFQQCRYSYYPESEVQTLARTFREKDIPADTIVLDIHYMDEYKIFSWDKSRFPNPKRMLKEIGDQGFKAVVIFDPGIKIKKGYEPYEDGLEEDVFIKYPDGEPYSGEVWPGWCHFPDFSNPATREWWKKHMKMYVEQGVGGYWNDMNEIATWGQYLPELMEMDFDGNPSTMRKGRNLYGMLMARATYESAKELMGNKRPFNLTRAAYAGIQRYSAVWTGDNVANDEHMLVGVRLVNSMGLSGISFSGYDIGGFAGNSSEHLFARWIQIGSFSPFFRAHSMINSRDSEPWSYGEEVEEISRNYIKLRYKLLMYLYSSFYESTRSGLPVTRSMVINHAHEEEIYDAAFQNQYYFGDALMVAPVESYKNLLKTYFPEGTWYEFFTDQVYEKGVHVVEAPIQQLPVFVKSSSIIPVCPEVGINTNDLGSLMEYHIYFGEESSIFTHYEDDGETGDFQNDDQVFRREIIFNPSDKEILLEKPKGGYESRFDRLKVYFHGFENRVFRIDGQAVETAKEDYRFIQPISSFDPFGNEAGTHLFIKDLRSVEIEGVSEKVKISW